MSNGIVFNSLYIGLDNLQPMKARLRVFRYYSNGLKLKFKYILEGEKASFTSSCPSLSGKEECGCCSGLFEVNDLDRSDGDWICRECEGGLI